MEYQDDMARGLDPAPARLVQELIKRGWLDDPRKPPQSNSAQAFVEQFLRRHRHVNNDEVTMVPDLADIVLNHNRDPHDTDVIGTVVDLLDYIWNRVL